MKSTKVLPSSAKDSQGFIILNDRLEDREGLEDHTLMIHSHLAKMVNDKNVEASKRILANVNHKSKGTSQL